MKKFSINSRKFTCDDKYNFAAIDRDGSISVYEILPIALNDAWSGLCYEKVYSDNCVYYNTVRLDKELCEMLLGPVEISNVC